MLSSELDEQLRLTAFAYLRARQLLTGGPVRYEDAAAFVFQGQRITLLDPQRGIRKPAVLDAALSFRTVHAPRPDLRPYFDEPGRDGYLRYQYRGVDGQHAENRALRSAMERRLPLIWFQGIEQGIYLPVYPVWIVGDEPEQHQFVVALNVEQLAAWDVTDAAERVVLRAYADVVVKQRVHQPVFRARVLSAYGQRCAVCNLHHAELLDAAHVKADADGGEPVVTNGIAMCKIHHAVFDTSILGIDADYVVHIRDDVLAENDGPTLEHAIKGVNGSPLRVLPDRRRARPDRELLAERFEQFSSAG